MRETEPRQAAYTKLDPIYPGYVNVTREGDKVTLSVRGDARNGQEGPFVSLPLSLGQWDIFMADVAHRLRSAA